MEEERRGSPERLRYESSNESVYGSNSENEFGNKGKFNYNVGGAYVAKGGGGNGGFAVRVKGVIDYLN